MKSSSLQALPECAVEAGALPLGGHAAEEHEQHPYGRCQHATDELQPRLPQASLGADHGGGWTPRGARLLPFLPSAQVLSSTTYFKASETASFAFIYVTMQRHCSAELY